MKREHYLDSALKTSRTAVEAFAKILAGQSQDRARKEQQRKWRLDKRQQRRRGEL